MGQALYAITSPNLTIQDSIGDFFRSLHCQLWWFYLEDTLEIYHERLDEYYEIYKLPTGVVVIQQTQYCWWAPFMDHPPNMEQTLVSIDRIDSTHIRLHSKATLPKEILTNFDFWDVLHSWPNQSLWRNFQCDGDGTWIRRGAMRGTLRMVHDGSYMSKVNPTICSDAFIITCMSTSQKAMGAIVERSDFADNSRAEGLGAIGGLLILRAAMGGDASNSHHSKINSIFIS